MLNNAARRHKLEVRNVTFTCTLDQESVFARLYSPPKVVHLLKDVSLEAASGEVHAVLGTSGSGKNILLEVIACTANGDTAGTIQLDTYTMTRSRFLKLCSFVPTRRQYPGYMTLRSLLYYTAALSFGRNIGSDEIEQRLYQLMRAFDLLGYGHEKLGDMSKSAQRRATVAVALVKDPLLLVLENPCYDLEPIACYQLMYCLRTYAVEQNRIVLIALNKPRSDICQMLSKVTVLFHGKVMYSGYIKNLIVFMRDAGLHCSEKDNPMMFYLARASVNRETQGTYEESFSEALRLIRFFKNYSPPANHSRLGKDHAHVGGTVALCHLHRPSSAKKVLVLVQRSFMITCSNVLSFVLRIVALPIFMLLLSVLRIDLLSGSWTIPHTCSRVLEITLLIVYLTGSCSTLLSYGRLLPLASVECSDGLYNRVLCSIAFICTVTTIDLISATTSTVLLLWMSNITSYEMIIRVVPVFASVFFTAVLVTMITMLYIRDRNACCAISITVLLLWMLFGGGLLRSQATYPFYAVTFFSYVNPIHYANFILALEITSQLPVQGCTRFERGGLDKTPNERFCRWSNGTSYVLEMFPESIQPRDYWSNISALAAIVLVLFLLMLFLHAIPRSRRPIDRNVMSK